MKKRIYVVTIFMFNNYGSNLQCYSMKKLLERLGYQAIFIDFRGHGSVLKVRFPKKLRDVFMWYKYFAVLKFLKRNKIEKTRPLNSIKELENYNFKDGDFIVGSDQTWIFDYQSDASIKYFYLDFVPHQAKKIAFSASFGSGSVNFRGKDAFVSSLLKKFDYVSVREGSGVDICRSLGVDSKLVLDPTLILGDFSDLTGTIEKKKDTLFTYIIQQRPEVVEATNKAVCYLMRQLNLSTTNNIVAVKKLSPENWVKKIHSASFVFTDSFHVCCFSIIGQCEFAVLITQPERATRIEYLLSILGIKGRLFTSLDDLYKAKFEETIDYKIVNEKLSLLRINSLAELKKVLS